MRWLIVRNIVCLGLHTSHPLPFRFHVYHFDWFSDHIFEKVTPPITALGLECNCLGGGKIEHNSKDKKLHVFGESTVSAFQFNVPVRAFSPEGNGHQTEERKTFSKPPENNICCVCVSHLFQGYGKADHSVSVEKLKSVFKDYEITWSDDKE